VQPLEFPDVRVRQEVPPQSEHLPELEEDHAALFQRLPYFNRRRPAAPPAQGREEPVARENAYDRHQTGQIAGRCQDTRRTYHGTKPHERAATKRGSSPVWRDPTHDRLVA